jgi:hypothetical protein
MRLWPLLLLLVGTLACATGVTSGAVDDDGGNGGSGLFGGSSSVGGTSNVGGSTGGMGGTSAGTGGAAGHPVWINEIHYDNDSGDTNEGVEIAGAAGIDLSQYEVELYNAGTSYATTPLSGSIPDQQNGFGTAWTAITGLQNGPNDGIALIVSQTSEVLYFLGYGGTSTATDGKASGMTSVDIGVQETNSTPVGQSLQLTGTGSSYASFTWMAPTTASTGQINTAQTFQ